MCKFGNMCRYNHPNLTDTNAPLPTTQQHAAPPPATLAATAAAAAALRGLLTKRPKNLDG